MRWKYAKRNRQDPRRGSGHSKSFIGTTTNRKGCSIRAWSHQKACQESEVTQVSPASLLFGARWYHPSCRLAEHRVNLGDDYANGSASYAAYHEFYYQGAGELTCPSTGQIITWSLLTTLLKGKYAVIFVHKISSFNLQTNSILLCSSM